MYLLLSGEGVTDIGGYKLGTDERHFEVGAMGVMVEQLINQYCLATYDYEPNLIAENNFTYVSKSELAQVVKNKNQKKGMILRGNKRGKETGYFFKNAKALAIWAKQLQLERPNVPIIAILFRDKDGNASAGDSLWIEKYESMQNGFKSENYSLGVPMIPNTKSEAWLLCAVKNNYRNCQKLENIKGNDDSPNSLKSQLAKVLGYEQTATALANLVNNRQVDVSLIDMPSFNQFRNDLEEAVELAHKH